MGAGGPGHLTGEKYVYGERIRPDQANVDGFRATLPVGSYPPNGFGLYDMVASVWQWCDDCTTRCIILFHPGKIPRPGKRLPKSSARGSWFHQDSLRVAVRLADDPLSRNFCFVTGFRCAKDAGKQG